MDQKSDIPVFQHDCQQAAVVGKAGQRMTAVIADVEYSCSADAPTDGMPVDIGLDGVPVHIAYIQRFL
ncbi:hypothetical protein ACQ86N_05590 [Puia sp. P3]|uniref:hypothetical protein n=1 Tax=Puia sp. P3 TaxID=3423952 RepID=UPI003D6688F3